jgi:hypothetical protein
VPRIGIMPRAGKSRLMTLLMENMRDNDPPSNEFPDFGAILETPDKVVPPALTPL